MADDQLTRAVLEELAQSQKQLTILVMAMRDYLSGDPAFDPQRFAYALRRRAAEMKLRAAGQQDPELSALLAFVLEDQKPVQ